MFSKIGVLKKFCNIHGKASVLNIVIQQSLNSGSAQVQILLAACQKLAPAGNNAAYRADRFCILGIDSATSLGILKILNSIANEKDVNSNNTRKTNSVSNILRSQETLVTIII